MSRKILFKILFAYRPIKHGKSTFSRFVAMYFGKYAFGKTLGLKYGWNMNVLHPMNPIGFNGWINTHGYIIQHNYGFNLKH
jgi:hypothetical protein